MVSFVKISVLYMLANQIFYVYDMVNSAVTHDLISEIIIGNPTIVRVSLADACIRVLNV